jgi:hypothetical protein
MSTVLAALTAVGVLGLAGAPSAFASPRVAPAAAGHVKAHKAHRHHASNADPTIYDATVQPNPGNLPSLGYEATSTSEFGNQITFAGSARVLDSVVVQMSSWACQTGGGATCATTPGTTFNEPVTLNIYNVGPANANGPSTLGSLIVSDTQTFAIPYRPSADPTNCSTAPDDGTQWYDAALATCFNGYVTNIAFSFGHLVLPTNVIYGIAYNTSDYGSAPYGHLTPCHTSGNNCGYDSLNVALSNEPPAPSVGSDPYQGTVYWNTSVAGFYCDAGAAGTGTFRIDEPTPYTANAGQTSNCWSVNNNSSSPWYVPAVQFNAVASTSPSFTSPSSGSVVAGPPFSFTVSTTGVPIPAINKIGGQLPKGLALVDNHNGTATISGTARTTDPNRAYTSILRAKNGKNSVAKQHLVLTLTGGR